MREIAVLPVASHTAGWVMVGYYSWLQESENSALIQGRGDAQSSYHDEAAALDKETDKYSAHALFC